jgi:hypothetical protein
MTETATRPRDLLPRDEARALRRLYGDAFADAEPFKRWLVRHCLANPLDRRGGAALRWVYEEECGNG